jgi:YD repeat-containing protein
MGKFSVIYTPDDKPIQVTDEKGKRRDITFENGNVTKVEQTNPDGTKILLLGKSENGTLQIRRPGTDEWLVVKDLKTVGDRGQITVGTDAGDFDIPGPEGGPIRPIKLVYPDGRVQEFSYVNMDGRLTGVRRPNGTVFSKNLDGSWTSIDSEGNKTILQDVSLDEKGNLTWRDGLVQIRENADGTGEKIDLEEGSTVKYDNRDRPVKITNAKGVRKIEYGEDNQPKSITDVDGKTTWIREGDNQWTRVGPDGKPTSDPPETYTGTAEVEPSGDIVWKQTGTDRVTRESTDGSRSTKEAGKSRSWDANGNLIETVTYDSKDRVVEVENLRGKRTFGYGPSDMIMKITEPDGSTWMLDGDIWKEYKNGAETGRLAEIEVNRETGSVERKETGSDETVNEYADGFRAVKKTDNSTVEYNTKDQISKVSRPDGSESCCGYNVVGELVEICESDGTIFHRDEKGTWTRTSADGKKHEVQNVKLDEAGNLSWDSAIPN